MPIELTVAVTTHAEDFLLRPTLRSVAEALDGVVAGGHASELLIVLDRPSDRTRREAARWRDELDTAFEVRTIEVDHGESGASRNSAIAEARGDFLALCDGDDLLSRDFLTKAHGLAAASDKPIVVHPAMVLSFGDRSLKWNVRSNDDPELTYLDLLAANLWPSCSLSRRTTYLRHPYPALRPGSGFGPEDYAWNISTSSAGIRHVVAPESVFFYRTRSTGGVNNAHSASILPPFDIQELKAGFPAVEFPERTQGPQLPTRGGLQLKDVLARVRPAVSRISRLIPRPLHAPLRRAVARLYHLIVPQPETPPTAPSLVRAMKDAAELEPALSWTANGIAHIDSWRAPSRQFASVLESLMNSLADTEVLILAPWVGVGGADLVTINYASALANASGLGGKVTVLTTYLPERTLGYLIPEGVRQYQLDPVFRDWPLSRQQRLLAQLVILLRPKLILSINCFDFTNALKKYSRPICNGTDVYLSLFAFDRIGEGDYPVNPITDDPHREFLHDIRGIITDNTVTASLVSNILGVDPSFVHVHHQSAAMPAYDFDEVVKQTAAYYDEHFSAEMPFRALWPHRLDKEKRPDSLLRIAQRIRDENLPIEIHVYGQRILNNGNHDLLPELTQLGVTYHGPYSGGLAELPTEDFHALLLTSETEGMPLVLAQSLLLGLPVIASAVGGVIDLITDRVTGLLTEGPDDIDGFMESLAALMHSRDLRRSLIRSGYDRAATQHGIDAFAERALGDLGLARQSAIASNSPLH